MSSNEFVKVVFVQEAEDGDEAEIECPWAESLGGNRYRLKNFPFFKYGISYDDIFEASSNVADDPRLYITKVIEKSGNKTLRIFFGESIETSEYSRNVLKTLNDFGCGYEGNGARFFVVNVQPHCNFNEVRDYVDSCELDWEYADPTYEELFPAGDE
jgi:hypothetical protein